MAAPTSRTVRKNILKPSGRESDPGRLGVASSNLAAPTNKIRDLAVEVQFSLQTSLQTPVFLQLPVGASRQYATPSQIRIQHLFGVLDRPAHRFGDLGFRCVGL